MTSGSFAAKGYDFADFGCGSGGSMKFAVDKLGGVAGIGLDINAGKVEAARAAGYDAEVMDVTRLDLAAIGTVRFVVISSLLIRLGSVEQVRACLRSAIAMADEFVLIRQPSADSDDYMRALGLQLHWSNWRAHKTPMKLSEFHDPARQLLNERKLQRYMLFHRTKIEDSSDRAVHPISSPPDQPAWDPEKHAPKPFFRFSYPVYREVGALFHTRSKKLSEPPRRFLLSCNVEYDSAA